MKVGDKVIYNNEIGIIVDIKKDFPFKTGKKDMYSILYEGMTTPYATTKETLKPAN
jgi:hypothetical protein